MKISEVTSCIEEFASPALQESYDNCGFQAGNPNQEITGALLCLDCTESVLDEAIEQNCNLIISHHPLIFGKGLKRLTGANYVERIIMKAIRNNLSIFSAHTNLDNIQKGVNAKIAEKLGIQSPKILSPKQNVYLKVVTFVPVQHADAVRDAMSAAGAGAIGDYTFCSFNVMGTGTFKAGENANPFAGQIGKMHREQEIRIEMIVPAYLKSRVVKAMFAAHPYEEVAYDLIPILNEGSDVGSGMIGELENEMNERDFLLFVKEKMNAKVVRHTSFIGKKVKKIAFCGGAGSFLLDDAKRLGADVFLTADYKYHGFFDAEGEILIADIGHFETEQYTPELFAELLNKYFSTFAVRLSKINTNPVNYL